MSCNLGGYLFFISVLFVYFGKWIILVAEIVFIVKIFIVFNVYLLVVFYYDYIFNLNVYSFVFFILRINISFFKSVCKIITYRKTLKNGLFPWF